MIEILSKFKTLFILGVFLGAAMSIQTILNPNTVIAQNCNYACGGSPHCCGAYECAGFHTCNPRTPWCTPARVCPDGSRTCGDCPTPTCTWGACSVSCGGGTQSDNCGNTRACNTHACGTPNPNPDPPPPTGGLICDHNEPMDPLCRGRAVGSSCGNGGTCQVPAGHTGWNGYRACTCGGQCNATSPAAVTQISPANGSTLPSTNAVSLSWNNTSFGVGCPSNNNLYQVYISTSASGPWTLAWQGGSTGTSVGGLTSNTRYYWYVRKTNGSLAVQSSVWNFKTNDWPDVYYNGQIATDVCGQGFSGRSGPANVTNPIRLSFNFDDADPADWLQSVQIAMVPRSLSGAASSIPQASILSWINTYRSFYFALAFNDNKVTNGYWAGHYNPSTGVWTGAGAGNLTNYNNSATIMNIGNSSTGTYMNRYNPNGATGRFQIRLENTFGSNISNPSGVWDIYALSASQSSDGSYHVPGNNWHMYRMGQWGVDLTLPSATISTPTYNADGTFNLTYGAADNLGVLDAVNYITRNSGSSTLRDNTIGQDLQFNFAQNVHRGSVNGGNYQTQPTRNYRDTSVDQGSQFNFRIDVADRGCNFATASINASQPVPWVMTNRGNVSINGNSIVNGVISGINIPDPTSFNITGLPGFNYVDGSSGPFFATYSTMSGNANVSRPVGNISKLRRYVSGYNNEGVNPPIGQSWYDYLKLIVNDNSNVLQFSTTAEASTGNTQFPVGQQYLGSLASIFGIPANEKRNVDATGNVWIGPGAVCDIKAIIFVSGNFRIGPNLTTTPGNACIFVVKGNVSIGTGSSGPVVPLTSATQPNYDIVEAMLISDGYIWADNNPVDASSKGEGLYIRGGVISSSYFEWNRDLNTLANAVHPAVLINNDPIYYQTFRQDLRIKEYSIKELR